MEVCLVLPVADIVEVTNEECSSEVSLPVVVEFSIPESGLLIIIKVVWLLIVCGWVQVLVGWVYKPSVSS